METLEEMNESVSEVISSMKMTISKQEEEIGRLEVTVQSHENKIQELMLLITELHMKLENLESCRRGKGDCLNNIWEADRKDEKLSKSISEIAKETAESVLGNESNSKYIYDVNSGLYYDELSGYYYDPVKGLFYNSLTGIYYSYDESSNEYKFHSQVQLACESSGNGSKNKRKGSRKKKIRGKKSSLSLEQKSCELQINKLKLKSEDSHKDDAEDGEISDESLTAQNQVSSPDSQDYDCDSADSVASSQSSHSSFPCIRAVILESPSKKHELKKGNLFIVPYTGGSVGREGNVHCILLPDISVSRNHAVIEYLAKENIGNFTIADVGSQNGTFLDGLRLSDPGQQSSPHEIKHGSKIRVRYSIGSFLLLAHVHQGSSTCGHCEPGLLIEKEALYPFTPDKLENTRKTQNKIIRQKYDLQPQIPQKLSQYTGVYKDRSKDRRVGQGSDNPYEKTEVASVDETIKKTNKGFQLLEKMGWKEGTSLGVGENNGITEPIKIDRKIGKGGVGSES